MKTYYTNNLHITIYTQFTHNLHTIYTSSHTISSSYELAISYKNRYCKRN